MNERLENEEKHERVNVEERTKKDLILNVEKIDKDEVLLPSHQIVNTFRRILTVVFLANLLLRGIL